MTKLDYFIISATVIILLGGVILSIYVLTEVVKELKADIEEFFNHFKIGG